MIETTVMPDDYNERVNLLHNILHKGIQELLVVAKAKNVLKPPYGRPPTPTPFVDDANDIDSFDDEDEEDDLVEFDYNYGFNPLTFLSEFIIKEHPNTKAARIRRINDCHQKLKKRALHAQTQLKIRKELRKTAEDLRCGILHGPFTTPLSGESVMCVCRPVATGEVVFQMSTDPTFPSDEGLVTMKAFAPDVGETVHITIGGLQPATHYYIRCCLQDAGYYSVEERINNQKLIALAQTDHHKPISRVASSRRAPPSRALSRIKDLPKELPPPDLPFTGRFRGVDEESFKSGEFWTLLPTDTEKITPFTLLTTSRTPFYTPPLSELKYDSYSFPEDLYGQRTAPCIHSILGDIFYPLTIRERENESEREREEMKRYQSTLWKHIQYSSAFNNHNSLLRAISMIISWEDRSPGCDTALKAEEVIYKQHQASLHKYERRMQRANRKSGNRGSLVPPTKPPPTLTRPPISASVHTINKDLPVVLKEDATRQFYRSIQIGSSCNLLVLDSRSGYLGKQQAKWIKETIYSSTISWTIILSGSPLGIESKSDIVELLNKTGSVKVIISDGVEGGKEGEKGVSGEKEKINENVKETERKEKRDQVEKDTEKEKEKEKGSTDTPDDEEEDKDEKEKEGDSDVHSLTDTGSIVLDDTDTIMLEKGSLQYALRSLQTKFLSPSVAAERDIAHRRGSLFEGDNLSDGGYLNSNLQDQIVEPFFEDDEELDDEEVIDIENIDKVLIDSGIIILTGGSQESYVNTYDWNNWESNYILEVAVGSAIEQPIINNKLKSNTMKGIRTQLFTSNQYYDVIGPEENTKNIPTGVSINLRKDGTILLRIYELALDPIMVSEDFEENDLSTDQEKFSTEGRVLYQVLCTHPEKELQSAIDNDEK